MQLASFFKKNAIALVLLCALSSTQAPCAEKELQIDKRDSQFLLNGAVLFYKNKPFTGVQLEKLPNGNIYLETQYKNGAKDGYEKRYTLSGKVKNLWQYKKGLKEGEQKAWFEDDSPMYLYKYKLGKLDGEQIEWHQSGTVFRRQYFKNGVEVERKVLFRSGEVFTNYVKKNGRTYGLDSGALCFDKKKDGEL